MLTRHQIRKHFSQLLLWETSKNLHSGPQSSQMPTEASKCEAGGRKGQAFSRGGDNVNWAEPGQSPHRPRETSHFSLTPKTPWQERWRSAGTHDCGCSCSVSGTPHNFLQWKQDKKYKINLCKGWILENIQSWWCNQAVLLSRFK